MNFMYSREYSEALVKSYNYPLRTDVPSANGVKLDKIRWTRNKVERLAAGIPEVVRSGAKRSTCKPSRHARFVREARCRRVHLRARLSCGRHHGALAARLAAVYELANPGGKLGLANYVTAFTQSIYLAPILNSLILATSVAAIATRSVHPLAWARRTH